jgi:hypothetical protein
MAKDALPWSGPEFREFTARIQRQQRKLLAAMLEHEPGALVSSERVRQYVGVAGNQALAGILSGVTKVALSLDIAPERIYLQTTRFQKGRPQRFYRVASGFLRAAAKYGWPSAEDSERQ